MHQLEFFNHQSLLVFWGERKPVNKVKNKWGTAGTLADMRMTAATATILHRQDAFDSIELLWAGAGRQSINE